MKGRLWLLDFINDAFLLKDNAMRDYFLIKKNPAIKSAEKLAEIQKERRELLSKYKALEYQLKTYEEYFPFLLDYQNEILNDEITGIVELDNKNVDPVNKFLTREEYLSLTISEKNQLALDRYINSNLSKSEIGKMYERYLGRFYELQGYNIEYSGIEKGFEDLGQDLICTKGDEVIIIQAKCWSTSKEIRERHIFQLYSTTLLHKMENPNVFSKYTCILYTTTRLSDTARYIANTLDVKYLEYFELEKDYPMIKCNINNKGEKIYHLPFDQMYDKVKIVKNTGEFYASSVREAEKNGFRRAMKYTGFKS